MSEGEIATTLQSQPDSVFLLATDPDLDDVYISYRKNQRTLHLKIEQDNDLGFGVETWEMGRIAAPSISGLVLALAAVVCLVVGDPVTASDAAITLIEAWHVDPKAHYFQHFSGRSHSNGY